MLKQIKDKVSAILEGFEEDLKNLEEQKSHIDEKYRKLADEEKREVVETIKILKAQIKSLSRMRDANESDKVEDEPQENPVEEEERVVDNLFPENNVENTANEDKGEDYISQQEIDNRNLHFPDDKIIPAEPDVKPEETAEEWPVENNDEPVQESDQDDDAWPAFPEEWK